MTPTVILFHSVFHQVIFLKRQPAFCPKDFFMQLPILLKHAIEHEAALIGLSKLTKAASELSDNYRFRQSANEKLIVTEAHRIAYTTTRMPATFAAIVAVLREVKKQLPDLSIQSLIDLGAGPGTAAWAAVHRPDPAQRHHDGLHH